jgi:hypothetical protein
LRGSRVTVLGDQVVCGDRCAPALSEFAERNGIESVDGIVFQREQINPPPPGFIGQQDLASPRTTLRTMTESKSTGRELIRREIPIYRRPATPPAGGSGGTVTAATASAEHASGGAPGSAVTASAEKTVVTDIERTAAREPPGYWATMANNFVKELQSITPAKLARFGKNLVLDAVKGYVTAKLVDYIIGDSPLEDDLAALGAANHAYHNDMPEKIRSFEKEAISLLPPEIAIVFALNIRFANPINADFMYEAKVQADKRAYDKYKEQFGDSEDANLLYLQSTKAEDDFYNGITPFDR